jgi:segregation and condensation protein B
MSNATDKSQRRRDAGPGPGSRTSDELAGCVEAVLLCADRPLPISRLAQAAGLVAESEEPGEQALRAAQSAIEEAVAGLNGVYERTGRAFRIESVAGGYRLMTLPKYARAIATLQQHRSQNRLSKAAVETLAIIAYRQPVTRAEVENIRGVACGEVLKTLLDHRLVTIQGRAEELGRPMLYGTTRQFLDTFGLASLKDLPAVGEFGVNA